MARDQIILDDVFEIIQKDPDGKKFDRGDWLDSTLLLQMCNRHSTCVEFRLAWWGARLSAAAVAAGPPAVAAAVAADELPSVPLYLPERVV